MMKPPEPPDEIEHLAPIRLRKDLLSRGHNDRSIARLVRDGALVRVRHGSYVEARAWVPLDAARRHVVLTRAVLARAQTESVASHHSAVTLWKGPAWDLDFSVAAITRLDGRAGRAEAGVQQHCGKLRPEDLTTRHGVPTTTAARAAMDYIASVDVEHGLVVANDFLFRGLTDLPGMGDCESHMTQWPDTLGSPHVLRLARPEIESVGETRSFFLCWDQGLPLPQPQFKVRGPDGEIVARLDFAWPELRVWLEFDGKQKYVKFLAEGETITDVVLREKRREKLIEDLTGWRCLRITWADLYHPERVAAQIRSLMRSVAA